MSLFEQSRAALRHVQPVSIIGQVDAAHGLTVSVAGFPAPLGGCCRITRGRTAVEGRVIGFDGRHTLVMPIGAVTGICRGDRVECTSTEQTIGLGREMLGRVLDGFGRGLDGRGGYRIETHKPIWPDPISPMKRERISDPLPTGVRAIDAMLTVGRGQRMGVFSRSGVGKSVLLGMIARHAGSDVTVIGLIGERGREVRDFIERDIGDEGLKRCVVIVSASDEPPLVRVQAGAVASAAAEYFREQGCDVLLLIDSLTRLATAQRQIGLVAGEPPTTKGYPPSVFTLLPQLLERSGRTAEGSVTGFYTVLVDGDGTSEPISDAVRAVTDGHICLSGELANRGQYPAIDVVASVSRVMDDVTDSDHQAAAKEIRRLISLHRDIEDLLNLGVYRGGANVEYDLAIAAKEMISRFLAQDVDAAADFDATMQATKELVRQINERRAKLQGDAADAPTGEYRSTAAETANERQP